MAYFSNVRTKHHTDGKRKENGGDGVTAVVKKFTEWIRNADVSRVFSIDRVQGLRA